MGDGLNYDPMNFAANYFRNKAAEWGGEVDISNVRNDDGVVGYIVDFTVQGVTFELASTGRRSLLDEERQKGAVSMVRDILVRAAAFNRDIVIFLPREHDNKMVFDPAYILDRDVERSKRSDEDWYWVQEASGVRFKPDYLEGAEPRRPDGEVCVTLPERDPSGQTELGGFE